MTEITYARVGGPPADFADLIVLKDGVEINDAVEVNAAEGWARRMWKDEDGRPHLETYRDTGRFEIRRKP